MLQLQSTYMYMYMYLFTLVEPKLVNVHVVFANISSAPAPNIASTTLAEKSVPLHFFTQHTSITLAGRSYMYGVWVHLSCTLQGGECLFYPVQFIYLYRYTLLLPSSLPPSVHHGPLCSSVQRLPAAGCSGAAGVCAGRSTRGPQQVSCPSSHCWSL